MRVLDLKAIRGTRTRLNVRERPCVSRPVGLVPYPVTTEETRVITSITHPDVCVFNLHLYFFSFSIRKSRLICIIRTRITIKKKTCNKIKLLNFFSVISSV